MRPFRFQRGVLAAIALALVSCEPASRPLDVSARVVSVTITTPPDSIAVGDSLQLSATIVSSGNRQQTVAWASLEPAVASVSAAGLVRGLAAGTAPIVATSGSRADTVPVTVLPDPAPPPPGGGGWPDEPAGFTLVSDERFDALTENGWAYVERQTTNGSGLALGLDATAPHSPASVLQFTYASGFTAGSEPGVEYYDPASPITETYFAFWWKPSSPWQNNSGSNVNKLAFLFPSAAGDIYLMMHGDGSGGYTIAAEPEFSGDTRLLTPNVTATPVTLGAWHLVEWHVKYATSGTSRDGVTEWWLDGVLQGSYGDLQTPTDAGFIEYQLAPTWGGVSGTKTETDSYWFDHARISRR